MSKLIHRFFLSDQLGSVSIERKKTLESYLQEELFPEEKEQLDSLKNEPRKIEFLGVRRLRNELDLISSIDYTSTRKPFLGMQLDTFISISHSKNYCALGVSSTEIGIDIEELSPRIERIASRFVNNAENQFLSEDTVLDLTKLWTMKEAMFKLNDRTGIAFKSELIIEERNGEIYSGRMLDSTGWRRVKLTCFQQDELVISACQYD